MGKNSDPVTKHGFFHIYDHIFLYQPPIEGTYGSYNSALVIFGFILLTWLHEDFLLYVVYKLMNAKKAVIINDDNARWKLCFISTLM